MSAPKHPREGALTFFVDCLHFSICACHPCVSSLRRDHANLLCIVPILTDDPRRESTILLFVDLGRRL